MELKKCWVVRDPDKFADDYRTADDLIYETTADGLVSLAIGTEAKPGRWVAENTKIYTDEASATADAEKRFGKLRKKKAGYDFR